MQRRRRLLKTLPPVPVKCYALRNRSCFLLRGGEPFKVGEIITTTVTTTDKFIQRDKPYLQMLLEFHNEKALLKARWWAMLILPRTRAEVARFASA